MRYMSMFIVVQMLQNYNGFFWYTTKLNTSTRATAKFVRCSVPH